MRIPRLYVPQPFSLHQTVTLEGDSAHYLLKVLRCTVGRRLVLFNGEGGEYHGDIVSLTKKRVDVQLDHFDSNNRQSSLKTELAIGVSRGDRFEWVLQKATELGVHAIVPLVTERTEVKLSGERAQKKQAHWQQIMVSSCEQCQRNQIPELRPISSIEQWITSSQSDCKLVLHHRTEKALKDITPPSSVSLLVGPEGGLSAEEITLAEQHDFLPLGLGPRVLRTETAPIAALSNLQYLWGDF